VCPLLPMERPPPGRVAWGCARRPWCAGSPREMPRVNLVTSGAVLATCRAKGSAALRSTPRGRPNSCAWLGPGSARSAGLLVCGASGAAVRRARRSGRRACHARTTLCAAASPARGVAAAVDTAQAESYRGTAVVYWDLDNKIPPRGISIRACVEALRANLLKDCRAVEPVRLYANTNTLSCAYGQLEGLGEAAGSPDDSLQKSSNLPNAPTTCPVCGKALKGKVWFRRRKLRRHLQMHREEFMKRAVMRACIGRNMRHGQRESFSHQNNKFIEGRKAIMGILGGMDGVVLRTLERDACKKIQDLGSTYMRPVPVVPQAADEEIIYDLRGLLTSPRAHNGSGTICLVSDDGGFKKTLKIARDHGWRLVIVAFRKAMREMADREVEWDELMVDAASVPRPPPGAGPDVFFYNPYRER